LPVFSLICWIRVPQAITKTEVAFFSGYTDNSGAIKRGGTELSLNPGGDHGEIVFSYKDAWGEVCETRCLLTNNDLSWGRWVHIAGTWSSAKGQMSLFINGESRSVASATLGKPNKPTDVLWSYMAKNRTGNFFSGTIDEVRLYQGVIDRNRLAFIISGIVGNNWPLASWE